MNLLAQLQRHFHAVFKAQGFRVSLGILVATELSMMLLVTQMRAIPSKRVELSQGIASLQRAIAGEKGYSRGAFCQSVEDENVLYLLGEWDTQEDLDRHLQSEFFKVVMGARHLLEEPHEVKIYCEIWGQTSLQRNVTHTAKERTKT